MNPAQRVLETLDRFIAAGNKHGSSTSISALWTDTFQLDKSDDAKYEVPRFLSLVRDEMELARLMLQQRGLPANLFEPAFRSLKDVTSPAHLSASRDSVWPSATDKTVRLRLEVSAWELRDVNEEVLSPADLKAFQDRFVELQSSASGLPSAMQEIMRRQAQAMLAALRVYRVRGGAQVREAVRSTVADIALHKDAVDAETKVATEEQKGTFSKGVDLLKSTAEMADKFSKVKKGAQDAWELGALAAPYVARYSQLAIEMVKQVATT
jgi:hypothetical protein